MTDLNSFKENIIKLMRYGFILSFECVAFPSLLRKLPELKRVFEKEVGVGFYIAPYISPDYQYSQEDIEILKGLGIRGRKFGFDFDGCGTLKQCNAGSKHFVIIPNGDVYACHAGFYCVTSPLHKEFSSPRGGFCLGNLFDGSFKSLTKPKLCSLPCSEACDLFGARVSILKEEGK